MRAGGRRLAGRRPVASAVLVTALTPAVLTPAVLTPAVLTPGVLTPAVLLAPATALAASSANRAAPEWSASPSPASSPASWPAFCAGELPARLPLDHGSLANPDDHSDLSLGTRGVSGPAADGARTPGTIAAGSGWHEFRLTASLPVQGPNSDLTDSPQEMQWTAFVADATGKGLPKSRVQYLNGSTWADLGQWAGAGTKPVTSAFDAGRSSQTATVSLRLRFKIDAGTPPGPAYVAEFGSYVDAQQACTHFTFATDTVTVNAADSWLSTSRLLLYAVAVAVVIAVVVAAASAAALVTRRRNVSRARHL